MTSNDSSSTGSPVAMSGIFSAMRVRYIPFFPMAEDKKHQALFERVSATEMHLYLAAVRLGRWVPN